MKRDLHNRLWNAQQRWFRLRAEAQTKYVLKVLGIREAGDPNRHTRNLIFAGSTLRTYEKILRAFVEFAYRERGCQHLEDIGKREFRTFMDQAIGQGMAAKTLHQYRSAISKLMALTGQAASGGALSRRYGDRIRQLVRDGALPGPSRATPPADVARRTVEILREWDARHLDRTGEPRAYHLAARLQIETAARSISATARLTGECLLPGNQVTLTGKSGKHTVSTISPDLYARLRDHLASRLGPLAHLRSYQAAWRRAVQAAGGQVTGTHGLRRLAAQEIYRHEYRRLLSSGSSPEDARRVARQEAVERLGHSRSRSDQAACYLGHAA